MFVTWTSEPSESLGSTDVTIKMVQHLRSKLHIYGYDNLTEEVTYDGTDNSIVLDGHAAYTANNNAFIPYIGVGTTNTALDA